MFYAFNLFQHNEDQIKHFDNSFNEFKSTPHDAVFVIFLGAVNHWVTVVAHKENSVTRLYLLDSSNYVYLDKIDEQIPEMIQKRNRDKVALGLQATVPFTLKMSVQNFIDVRKALEIIIDVFSGRHSLIQHYCSSQALNVIRQFHGYTSHMTQN